MSVEAYHRPQRLEDALRLMASREGARYIAGGTDLLVGTGPPPARLVSLRGIAELGGIAGGRIGALTTIGELARDEALARDYPVLAQAARRLGSEQIRNQATIGGNLCRAAPCADTAPPLIVLRATVEIAGPDGTREMPVESFFRGPGVTALTPGEILTAVRLPAPRPAARSVFLKKGRVQMDLSIASVAALVETDGARLTRVRLAAGSVAPTPLRLQEVEASLEGEEPTEAVLARAGDLAARSVLPITDVRSTEAYRRHVVGVYVRRAVRQAAEDASS